MSDPIPFVDLDAIHAPLRERMLAAMAEVVHSDRYILGPEVEAFEGELARWCGVPHAVGVSSGTDALIASLMALDVGPGDEVVTTPFTYIATAQAIARVGAKPVFADIEADSFNLDPAALQRAVTSATSAVIPVHLFGRACDMRAVNGVARAHGLAVIEDAAQAIGATWEGRQVGSHGHAGCLSFFPAKNLGGLGDGGAVLTTDEELAERLRRVRVHGAERRYVHGELGGNFRLDALQAAALRVKLPELERWTSRREANASRYDTLFVEADLGEAVIPPPRGPVRHVYNQYVIRVTDGRRDEVLEALRAESIGCAVYYPLPLHLQPCFADLGYAPRDFPEAERACDEVLALPIAPGVTPEQQTRVVDVIAGTLG